nr:zinc finger, CCHC-type [Tanacetum cinerariifolium]
MAGNTMKDMTTNFGKLDKFEGHDFRRWQKKMHFLLTKLKVVYVLTTPMPELLEDATVEAIRIREKWENDDYICKGHILNDQSMEQYNELLRILGQYTQHGLKMDESISVSSIIDKLPPSWKDFKHTLKHGKDDLSLVKLSSHLRIEESLRVQDSDKSKGKEVGGPSVNMIEEGKNKHNKQNKGKKRSNENNSGSSSNKKPKLECWKCGKTGHFKRDCRIGKKNNTNAGGSGKRSKDQSQDQFDAITWWIDSGATTHVCKDRCWFKAFEPVEDGSVLYMGDEHFAHVHGKGSIALEFSFGKLLLCLMCIIHETTAPYTPQQNGVAERKNRALKEMVNSMLSYSGLSEGFWGEAMLTACYLLNRVPNKRNKATPYELWYKKRPNLSFLRVWGCRAMVRLPYPKRKSLGEKGINCIFVGYVENSNAYRFYVIEPNESISINSIIESRDAIFDENRFSSIPRLKDIIPNVQESQMDDHTDDVPNEIPEPQKGKRVRKAKSYGSDFHLYLVEELRAQVGSQYSYCYSIEEDPRTYNEAMQSRDAVFWKEAIDDEIGCKWIFKRKMKVDGLIDKFKARLIIQGFRQKERIDYFDTYAPVSRITTIRLLLALATIHNLVIYQMDAKTTFLNGDLDEEVYMKQPKGFVMPCNEHKVFDETKKFLSSRFSIKDMGEADVILGIKIKHKNNGIVITQSSYIEKILKKFNHEDCSPVSTPMDPVEKLKPNTGKPVDQLEYSRAVGCLMYEMTSTRPDIAYDVGRLSRFTSNPSRQHWKAITRVFKYLRGTKDYGLSYVGYPSVLEGYSNASWINHVED